MRRSTQGRSPFLARLACVKHAASVQSEPGSNSSVQSLLIVLRLSESWLPDSLFNCQRPTSSPGASRQAEAGIYPTPPRSSSAFFRTARLFSGRRRVPSDPSAEAGLYAAVPASSRPFVDFFFVDSPPRRCRLVRAKGQASRSSHSRQGPFGFFFEVASPRLRPALAGPSEGRGYLPASPSAVKPSLGRLNVVSWQRSRFQAARRAAGAGFSGPAKKRPRSVRTGPLEKRTWRRPTFPRMDTQYHRPWRA